MTLPQSHAVLRPNCDDCLAHSRAICASGSHDAKRALQALSRRRRYRAGQTITAERGKSTFLGNVVSGIVKMSRTLEDGRQQIVGLLFPSDFFGRPFQPDSSFSYDAVSDVEICSFERRAFEALLQQHPDIEHGLLVKALTDLDATREWMVLLGCQSVRERVASFFLLLLRRTMSAGCEQVPLPARGVVTFPIGRKDIALCLGTTPETLSRQIQWMVRNGIVRTSDSQTFEIEDPVRLARMAGRADWAQRSSLIPLLAEGTQSIGSAELPDQPAAIHDRKPAEWVLDEKVGGGNDVHAGFDGRHRR